MTRRRPDLVATCSDTVRRTVIAFEHAWTFSQIVLRGSRGRRSIRQCIRKSTKKETSIIGCESDSQRRCVPVWIGVAATKRAFPVGSTGRASRSSPVALPAFSEADEKEDSACDHRTSAYNVETLEQQAGRLRRPD
jgi:hypothetical protein